MRTLWAASFRHLLRHPAQLALALVGLSLGVGTIIAVDIATASSGRAFELSMEAVNGGATHQIVGGPQGIDERLYVDLRRGGDGGGAGARRGATSGTQGLGRVRAAFAPVVEGYVVVGDRTMQLVGIDPLASRELEAAGERRASLPVAPRRAGESGAGSAADRYEAIRKWFTEPGAVIMAAGTARELGLATGSKFELSVGGVRHAATLIAQIQGEGAGYDALILTDIAQAQEWMSFVGKLSRIDVRVAEGSPAAAGGAKAEADTAQGVAGGMQIGSGTTREVAGGARATRGGQADAVVETLRARLPPDVQIHEARGRTRESLDMTGAFTTNLKAMSLLALLVSTLLIYGAISFAVVQRRRIIGILRALGATRSDVLVIVLTEAAALGLVGACLGLLLGWAIGRELVSLVSRTINDLYFVVAVNETSLPAVSVVKALLAGFGTALAAALLPGLEVAASAPQLGLRRSVLEARAVHIARRLLIASGVLAAGAGVIVAVSHRSLFAGFVSLFLLLLSVAAVTPAMLRALAQVAARVVGRASPVVRLAFSDIAASLSRTGVAVAALGMAVAAMIGVSIMVESFRESLREWLAHTMRADVYVTAPGPGTERPERRLEPDVIRALLATPGITDHTESRSVIVEAPSGPVPLDALKLIPASYGALRITEGDSQRAWQEFDRGAIVISEPLAWRVQLATGDSLTLSTASGPHAFRIAGIYREYGNDRGTVLMNLAEYRRWWHDDGITAMGMYLAPAAKPATVISGLRAAAHGRQALLIRSNADIRALSMSIFERTFVITRVLYWLAAGVAAVGLISALLAWELERSHELAIVRSLGLTPTGAAVLIEAQTGFMGVAALLAAVPAGVLTALVLTEVINRRAFGWQIDLHLSSAQFTNALLLSLTAALAAGLYPAWRTAHAPIAGEIREE